MQTARIVQAVILMMIVAMAASCASGKEYTTRLFAPRSPTIIDSHAVTIRFLKADTMNVEKEGWVTTDIIKGSDTSANSVVLENLSRTIKIDSIEVIENKTLPKVVPVAKNSNSGEVRKKRTRDLQ